jgi:phosphate transport system substrate-binding protein
MRNTQPPTSGSQASSAYLIVKIDKRAALLFVGGLAFTAFVFVLLFREQVAFDAMQAVRPAPDSAAAISSAPANLSSSAQEPGSVISPAAAIEEAPPVEPPASDHDTDPSTSAPQLPPPVIISRTTATAYYVPLQPTPADPPQTDSSPADTLYPNPPSNPDLPSKPDPAPNVPPDPYDPTAPAIVNGAGAAFPYPLYSKWFDEFHKLHPNVQFNYQAVGSGAGIKQLQEKVVDFAGTDVPISDPRLSRTGVSLLYVPSVIGGVVPAYNLPEMTELRFTPQILAEIYSGRVLYWNDPVIAAVNPTINLPGLPIVVIHRSDGCGATFIFTDYLSKVSSDWQQTVGMGTSVNWPIGLGGKGNEGVMGLLRETPGSIAYVDFLYALQNQIPFGSVRNQTGRFIKANLASLTAAGSLASNTSDFRVSITNAPGADAYPISSFTWILAPVRSRNTSEARDLRAFLHWMLAGHPQDTARNLGYAPLPQELVARIDREVSRIH